MYDADDKFTSFLNVVTPIVLMLLGIILPFLAKEEKKRGVSNIGQLIWYIITNKSKN